MQPSNACQQMLRGEYAKPDPGDAGYIHIDRNWLYVALTSVGTETRIMNAPARAGLSARLAMKTDGGDITVTVKDSAGSTTGTIIFNDPADWVELGSIEASAGLFAWRALATYGTTCTVATSTTNTTATGVTYAGATTANSLIFPTNLGDGLSIVDSAAVDFVVFDSTTATPILNIAQNSVLATGKNLTLAVGAGYVQVNAATSGGIKILPTAETVSLVTLTTAAQSGGTGVATIPDLTHTTDSFAMVALAQTLTNKTLTSPVLTAPVIATGGKIVDAGGDEYMVFTEATTPFTYVGIVSGNTGVAPAVRGQGETNTALLLAGTGTGKVRIGDGADITKRMTFELVGATTGKTMTIVGSHTDDRALTLPDVTDTLATLGGTETFTAKTLTAPTINGSKVGVNNTAYTAAGSTTTDATVIGDYDVVKVIATTGQTGYGVRLPALAAGRRVVVINTTAYACKLYPNTSGTIDGLAGNAAVVIAASKRYWVWATATDTLWTLEAVGATAA